MGHKQSRRSLQHSMEVQMKRLNYANVTATLALFFAMSSGALAVNHYIINNTNQIKPSVLRQLRGPTGAAGPENSCEVEHHAQVGCVTPLPGPKGEKGEPGPAAMN